MKADIRDVDALTVISPASLAAYARVMGWEKAEPYGAHSDVYSANNLPEIILPRTQNLGDYSSVVSQLIGIFSSVADYDEISVYRDLTTADRDVVRVRALGNDDGNIAVNVGVDMLSGARDMLLAAACSLDANDRRALYRSRANRQANRYVDSIRLGQTEQGSFVIALLTPIVSPRTQLSYNEEPMERRITVHLTHTLEAVQTATERTVIGESDAFSEAVRQGVSANLCEALVKLVDPFPALDVSVSWAWTRSINKQRSSVRFASSDVPILRDAAQSLRESEPRLDTRLFGYVQRLKRDERETEGTITLRAPIDENTYSVTAVLNQRDYQQAIRAHESKSLAIVEGDLERVNNRWHLTNAKIASVVWKEDDEDMIE